MYRDLHPRLPWLYPLTDVRPQGEPELQSFTGRDVLLVLHVRGAEAFGNIGELFGIRIRDDGTMTAALAEGAIDITHPANFNDRDMEC
jgi:hypothetical protein